VAALHEAAGIDDPDFAVRLGEGPFISLSADFAHRALLIIGLLLWEATKWVSAAAWLVH